MLTAVHSVEASLPGPCEGRQPPGAKFQRAIKPSFKKKIIIMLKKIIQVRYLIIMG